MHGCLIIVFVMLFAVDYLYTVCILVIVEGHTKTIIF